MANRSFSKRFFFFFLFCLLYFFILLLALGRKGEGFWDSSRGLFKPPSTNGTYVQVLLSSSYHDGANLDYSNPLFNKQ